MVIFMLRLVHSIQGSFKRCEYLLVPFTDEGMQLKAAETSKVVENPG